MDARTRLLHLRRCSYICLICVIEIVEKLSLSLSLLAFRWNRIVWNKQYFNIIRIYIFFFFVHFFVANWNSFEWNSIVPGQEKFSRRTVKKCLVKSVKLVTCFQTFLEIDNRPTLVHTRTFEVHVYTGRKG